MRICHLIYDDVANPWLGGGGAVRARQIYTRLAERHQITLISGRFPGAAAEEVEGGIRVLRVGSERSYALSRLGYCRRAPALLAELEWDLWVNEFSAFAPLWVPRPLRQRGLLFFQHFVGAHALVKQPLVGAFSWAAEERALRAYGRILTVSAGVQRAIGRRLAGRGAQIDCVHNGVDSHYFALSPEEGGYLLYFGRADIHTKGLDLLIPAFARVAPAYPGLSLVIAGRGAQSRLQKLRAMARRAGVGERVQVLGAVGEADKDELLRRALFVCMPSRYEGWGMVAVEAAACGKAVLGTRIDGLQEAVRDGETGLLVEPGRLEAVAAGMRQLLEDEAGRRRLGERGREWARRFDWEQLAHAQEAVYLRAVEAL